MFTPKRSFISPGNGASRFAAACAAAVAFMLIATRATAASTLDASPGNDAEEKLYFGPEIVVTASRIEWPVSKTASFITVIRRDDIARAHAENVGELLRSVSGLNVVQSGSRGKAVSVFIRGANSNHCLVLLDGVPLNDPTTGAFDFSVLDAASIERIEIVRGANGILYGSSAIGGVIHIITSTKEEGARRSVSLAGGSFRTAEGSVTIAGGSASTHYSYSLSGATTDGQAANDFYRTVSFAGFVSSKVTPTSKVSASLRYGEADIGLRGPSFDFDPNAEQGGGHFLISAVYEQSVTGRWRHNLRTSFGTREITWDDPLDSLDAGPLAGNAFSEINSNVKNIMWQNDLRFAEGLWLISGTEWKEEQTTNSGYSPYGTTSFNDKISTASLFANGIADIAGFPTLSAGVRLDDHSQFGAVSTYKFSLSYPLPRLATTLKGSFGTGFRSPSLNELYYPGYGNPNLAPERSRGWDCGIRHNIESGRASFGLAYFNNSYRNMITSNPATWLADNIGEAKSDGVECEASLRVASAFMLEGAYAYTRTEDCSTGKELLRRPQNSGSCSVSYRRNTYDVHVSGIFIGKRLDNDFYGPRGEYYNPACSIFDVAVTYRIGGAHELFCKVRNLTDEQYDEVAGYPAPGMNFMAGVTLGI